MIVKEAQSKAADIEILLGIMKNPGVGAETKKRIEQEIRNINAGARGEEEAAYEMKVHFGESQNWAIIHDLRVRQGDLVAQIDHLVINRWLDIWVCESKHFAEGVAINEHGEFTAFYSGRPYGVASPIEQNGKHIKVLEKIFQSGRVEFPTRLGFTISPKVKSLVLVSKRARISRPKKTIPGIETLIKNDQFFAVVDKATEDSGLLSMGRIIGSDTLKEVARQIANLHEPIEFNWPAKFGITVQNSTMTFDVQQGNLNNENADPKEIRILGGSASEATGATVQPRVEPNVASEPPASSQKEKVKLICHRCTNPIPFNEARFCWLNKARFGEYVYCRDCQNEIPK